MKENKNLNINFTMLIDFLENILNENGDKYVLTDFHRPSLENNDLVVINFKNKENGKDVIFNFKNGYIDCKGLDAKTEKKVLTSFLEKFDKESYDEIINSISSSKEMIDNVLFKHIYDANCLRTKELGVDLNLLKQIVGLDSYYYTIVTPSHNEIDFKEIKKGCIYTFENSIVLGKNSSAKTRPFMVLGKSKDKNLVYGCFMFSKNDNNFKSREAVDLKYFDSDYLKKKNKNSSFVDYDTFQAISSDRIIEKVGQLDSNALEYYYKNALKFIAKEIKETEENTTITTLEVHPKTTNKEKDLDQKQGKNIKVKNEQKLEELDEKVAAEVATKLTNSDEWISFPENTKYRELFYDTNNVFRCDYNDVQLKKTVIDQITQEIINYCKEQGVKISNTEKSIVVQENLDNISIIVNNGVKNVKMFPIRVFYVDRFNVKANSNKGKINQDLTNKLRQLQQQVNPLYYIYYTNFLFVAMAKKDIDEKEFLNKNGINYKGDIYIPSSLDIDYIQISKDYFNTNELESFSEK